MEILINNQQKAIKLNPRRLKRIAEEVLRCEKAADDGVELSLVFCDDDFIQKLNREYRGHDCPTDVLAFPQGLDEPTPPGMHLLGDFVVSTETSRRQAARLGHAVELEVTFLLVHGILHLLGHLHDTTAQRQRMRQREQLICGILGEKRLLGDHPEPPEPLTGRTAN